MRPAAEDVGNHCHRRRGERTEPAAKWVLEFGEGEHHGPETGRREVLGVLGAGGDAGVCGKRKDERRDGERVGGKKRRENREVFGGDDDGNGEETGGCKVVGQVQDWDHVALCRIRNHQDVG